MPYRDRRAIVLGFIGQYDLQKLGVEYAVLLRKMPNAHSVLCAAQVQ